MFFSAIYLNLWRKKIRFELLNYGEMRCSNACLVRCGAGRASDTQLRLAPEVGRGVVGLLSLTRPLYWGRVRRHTSAEPSLPPHPRICHTATRCRAHTYTSILSHRHTVTQTGYPAHCIPSLADCHANIVSHRHIVTQTCCHISQNYLVTQLIESVS